MALSRTAGSPPAQMAAILTPSTFTDLQKARGGQSSPFPTQDEAPISTLVVGHQSSPGSSPATGMNPSPEAPSPPGPPPRCIPAPSPSRIPERLPLWRSPCPDSGGGEHRCPPGSHPAAGCPAPARPFPALSRPRTAPTRPPHRSSIPLRHRAGARAPSIDRSGTPLHAAPNQRLGGPAAGNTLRKCLIQSAPRSSPSPRSIGQRRGGAGGAVSTWRPEGE